MNRQSGLTRVVFGLAMVGVTAFGFVSNVNDNGMKRRWKLANPNPFLVDPNVVNPRSKSIRFFLAEDGFSQANRAAELNALRIAFGQWQEIPGTVVRFEDAGLVSSGVDVNVFDNTNVVFWAKSSTLVNGQKDDIRGRLGLAFTSFFEDNTIAESDIVFNGVEFQWFTDVTAPDGDKWFVETVALHEIGHLLGLEHAPIGGPVMLSRGSRGLAQQSRLSADEIAYARAIYPTSSSVQNLGAIRGTVTREAKGIPGAVVVVEDGTGDIASATLSRRESPRIAAGEFELSGLAPGSYEIRVVPLDPDSSNAALVKGREISVAQFRDAPTDFLPSAPRSVSVAAGTTTEIALAVVRGDPAFRITGIRVPGTDRNTFGRVNTPVTLRQGDRETIVGVTGDPLPAEGATLSITGDGLTMGPTESLPDFQSFDHLSMTVSVAVDATPGLRSFVVRRGEDVAYANGFIEILPASLDVNFDGLEDAFQRRFFPVFTAPEAGPEEDPDGDGFTNAQEEAGNSDPTDPASIPRPAPAPFRVTKVFLDAGGAVVTFESELGVRYRLLSRRDIARDPWLPRGEAVTATGSSTVIRDPDAIDEFRFYRVESQP